MRIQCGLHQHLTLLGDKVGRDRREVFKALGKDSVGCKKSHSHLLQVSLKTTDGAHPVEQVAIVARDMPGPSFLLQGWTTAVSSTTLDFHQELGQENSA